MDIRKDIFLKYLEMAAIEQLAFEYKQKGYKVITEPPMGSIRADLIVEKEQDIIVFEIKAGDWTQRKRQSVKRIRNKAVHELGAKFKLVLVKLPEEPDIIVEDLESLFFELLPDRFINEFDRLATHYWIDEIADIKFEELFVRKAEIEAKGSATVTLGLQYGSDSDYKRGDGIRNIESFPFIFHISVDKDLQLKEVYSLELETPEDLK